MSITIQQIIEKAQTIIPDLNEERVLDAYEFAKESHEGQKRQSGEPYIIHPLAVTYNLLSLNPDEETIMASLLHDVLEDTDVTPEEMKKKFGPVVLKLSQGVEKISKIHLQGKDRQIGSLRKMFLAMAEDLRVIFIKLADRLHNMSTLESMLPEKQRRMAEETLNIYAPIAGRLGIYHYKSPLEDLSFKYLYPEDYQWLSKEMNKLESKRERKITRIKNKLKKTLGECKFDYKLSGRVKHFYSIYKKLKKHNKEHLEQIYDIFALRIIVGTTGECYSVLGEIHKHWTPLSYRFKDYIAVPKPNGYQSLHTTTIGLLNGTKAQPVEIQIRTQDMHKEAEYGVASHWAYKEGHSPRRTKWVQGLVDLEQTLQDNMEFEENLKQDTFGDRIFVLTPMGDIKDLPNGATPIDFAYSVHTEIGNRCTGARINEKIVPLDHLLKNGDVAEILTNKNNTPNQFWLNFVVTSQAKQRIKAWFRSQDSDKLIKAGRDLLNNQLKRLGHNKLDPHLLTLKNYENKKLNYREREHILEKIGNGSLSPLLTVKKLFPNDALLAPKKIKKVKSDLDKDNQPRVIVSGEEIYKTKLAACCKPTEKDQIVGYVTRGKYISVHSQQCKIISRLSHKDRLINVSWSTVKPKHKVKLVIQTLDRIGMIHDITHIFAIHNVNIFSMTFGENRTTSGIHDMTFVIEVESVDRLNHIANRLESVKGVKNIKRVIE